MAPPRVPFTPVTAAEWPSSPSELTEIILDFPSSPEAESHSPEASEASEDNTQSSGTFGSNIHIARDTTIDVQRPNARLMNQAIQHFHLPPPPSSAPAKTSLDRHRRPEHLAKFYRQQQDHISWVRQSDEARGDGDFDYLDAPLQRRQVRLPDGCDGSSPFHLFQQFFSEAQYRQLAAHTNENILHHSMNPDGPKNIPKIVTVMEMKILIAFLLIMSIYRLPNAKMYWESGQGRPSFPWMRGMMSFYRFRRIWTFFKVSRREDEAKAPDQAGVAPKVGLPHFLRGMLRNFR
jgi:hypothetical protein